MGLDTYAVRPLAEDDLSEEEKAMDPPPLWGPPADLSIFEGIELCGGMMSANGSGSFRGKVYAEYVEQITGLSLYEAMIEPDTVRHMANLLEADLPDPDAKGDAIAYEGDWNVTVEDARNLAKWFRACADNGLHVHGWW